MIKDNTKKKLLKNIFSRISLFSLLRLSGFIALPIWAAVISPEQLAIIAILSTIPKLFITFSGLGYEVILNKVVFRYSLVKCHKYIMSFLFLRLLIGLIFGLILTFLFGLINTKLFHNKISFSAWLMMISVGCMRILVNIYDFIAELKLYARAYFILNSIDTVVQSWLFVFIAYFIMRNYMASVYATFIVNLILLCYCLWKFYLPIMKRENIKVKLMRKFLFPSMPMYFAGILNWIKSSIDSFVFSWMGLFPVLGILNMGKGLASPYDQLQRSFRQPTTNIFASDYEKHNDPTKMFEVSNIFFICMIGFILLYDEAIRWYVFRFVNKDYSQAISILIFILIWFLLRDLQVFLFRIALKNNNFFFSSITTSCVSIFTTFSYIIFIPRFGLNGAMYSLVLVEACVGIVGSYYILSKYGLDFYTLFKIILTTSFLFIMINVQNDTILRIVSKLTIFICLAIYLLARRNKLIPHTVKLITQYFS